jgi:hypothetical protein
MRLRNQNQGEKLRFSREELRTVILFWSFWSTYALLAVFLVVTLLTDWPEFLHGAGQSIGP